MKLRESTDFIIVHHSVSSPNTTVAEIRKWHKERKYLEIGYHYIITGDGEIHLGRFEQYSGAHCPQGSMNHISFGICLTGDFTKVKPTPEQHTSLLNLLVDLSHKHAIDASNILGHNEVEGTNTLCPGHLLNMNDIRAYVLKQQNKLQKEMEVAYIDFAKQFKEEEPTKSSIVVLDDAPLPDMNPVKKKTSKIGSKK